MDPTSSRFQLENDLNDSCLNVKQTTIYSGVSLRFVPILQMHL